MNWGLLAMMIMVMVGMLTITYAAISYIRHWAAKQESLAHAEALAGGQFFKRYIPPRLREQYDREKQETEIAYARSVSTLKTTLTLITVAALVIALGSSAYFNRDNFQSEIELSEEEIKSLVFTRHEIVKVADSKLPQLDKMLGLLKKTGLIIMRSDEDQSHLYKNESTVIDEQWNDFIEKHDIPSVSCYWSKLIECPEVDQNWLVVVQGEWPLQQIEQMLGQGAHFILYGYPQKVLEENQTLIWQGMEFIPYKRVAPIHLAISGDQTLTLGLDAGLTLPIEAGFTGARVFSQTPQAIGVDETHTAGGMAETRIYAKTVGKGRFVWLDFSPNLVQHASDINKDHFKALTASIFRYLLKQEYGAWASWPQGRKFAGLIEEDTEDQYHHAENVIDVLLEHNYPITWYILSDLAQKNRELTRKMAQVGEIACHGDSHEPFTKSQLIAQVERLTRCQKVLAEVTGEEVLGFRPPEEKYNKETFDAALNVGLQYFFGSNNSDRAVPHIEYSKTSRQQFVSIPRRVTDDFDLWHNWKIPYKATIHLVTDEMKWAEVAGGLYAFSFHTQFMGDESNVRVVDYIGQQLRARDAFFATSGDIAKWWLLRHKLVENKGLKAIDIAHFKPTYLEVDSDGKLSKTTIGSKADLALLKGR